ncbi:MAG: hypothetical protein K2O00_07910 [Muribaculaceae bacterium]|nr:hypothetical protein [Muribaculaceae bacterium]
MSEKNLFYKSADTLTALSKVMLESHRSHIPRVTDPDRRLIVMGNGPSLRQTMADSMEQLQAADTMAVNFAANAPEFFEVRPRYYVLADPHFFSQEPNVNVVKLWENLSAADWDMMLLVPFGVKLPPQCRLKTVRFNAVGIDAPEWLETRLFDMCRAMPRPRNVLIPAIMLGVWIGYKDIVIVGADHSWMRTLGVDSSNRIISVQPHFYKEPVGEQKRVDSEYSAYHLHQIVHSFYVAFNAYHQIARYAAKKGILITNATPESFIDAFPRVNF